MNSSLRKAEIIKLKIVALLEQYQLLERDMEALRKENRNLQQILLNQTKRTEIVEERSKISKLAEGIQLSKQDITDVKLKINRYIREIDECLKLLKHLPDNN